MLADNTIASRFDVEPDLNYVQGYYQRKEGNASRSQAVA